MCAQFAHVAPIQKFIGFSRKIMGNANEFIKRILGVGPFLAFHWRRGDRGHRENGVNGIVDMKSANVHVMYTKLSKAVQMTGVLKLFCMTNIGTEEDFEELAVLLQGCGAQLYRYPKYTHWTQELLHLVTEQAIASKADYFMPSGPTFHTSSSPSRMVWEWRRLLFHKSADSILLGPHNDIANAETLQWQYRPTRVYWGTSNGKYRAMHWYPLSETISQFRIRIASRLFKQSEVTTTPLHQLRLVDVDGAETDVGCTTQRSLVVQRNLHQIPSFVLAHLPSVLAP